MAQGISNSDLYHLKRFLDAQDNTFEQARSELAAGQKRSHWMWFVFPQFRGLGSSAMARRFAIGSLEEAEAYLEHPVLGSRLRECTALVNAVEERSAHDIFGYPDDLKFHSSITLFAHAAEGSHLNDSVFQQAIRKHFAGREDPGTMSLLGTAKT